jgi:hypothetical protein
MSYVKDIFVFDHDDQALFTFDHTKKIEFSNEQSIKFFLTQTLFKENQGHYIRGGPLRYPRIIIFAWKGKAWAFLNVKSRTNISDDENIKGHQEHPVSSVEWFEKSVDLTKLGIRNIRDDPVISHEMFEKIKKLAGKTTIFK